MGYISHHVWFPPRRRIVRSPPPVTITRSQTTILPTRSPSLCPHHFFLTNVLVLERDTAGTSSLFVGFWTGPCRRVQDYWTHQVPAALSERSPPFSRLSLGRSDDGHRRDRRRAKDGDDFKDDPAGMLLSVGTGVRDANMPPCAQLCALNKAAILTTLAAGTNLAHVTPSRHIFLLTLAMHPKFSRFPCFSLSGAKYTQLCVVQTACLHISSRMISPAPVRTPGGPTPSTSVVKSFAGSH